MSEFTIKLGAVVHDTEGRAYVYYGRTLSSIGTWSQHFVMERTGRNWPVSPPWFYHAVSLDTLLRKFPDLVVERVTENP